jgi:hypothetical protein
MCHHLLVLLRQLQEPGAVRLNLLLVLLEVMLDSLLDYGRQKLFLFPFHRLTWPFWSRLDGNGPACRGAGGYNSRRTLQLFCPFDKLLYFVPISTGKHSGVLTLILTLYGNTLTKTRWHYCTEKF